MNRHSIITTLTLIALLALGLSASAQSDDLLIVALNMDDVITLDPARAFESTNLTVFHAVYETLLVTPAEDLSRIDPNLAESYEISDDGLVYTFHLDKNAKFASGNPVTAEDVRFSWTRLQNIKAIRPSRDRFGRQSIEAVDDGTVKVTLAAPFPAFASVVTAPAMSILDSQIAKEHGATDAADADTTDTAKEWLDQNSAGSGPFILIGWSPNSEITMVRNESYWKGPVGLAGVTLKAVTDASTKLQLVERGDADIAQGIDADTAQQVKDKPGLELTIGQSLNLFYLALSPSDFFNLHCQISECARPSPTPSTTTASSTTCCKATRIVPPRRCLSA
jgi:peptide/nickel transport system substrate-binding protein